MISVSKFITCRPDNDFRLIALSDLHGGLHLFKQLLEQLRLQDTDYLVLIGDSIEKGPFSAEMIVFLKELSKRPKTFILMGNCERFITSLLLSAESAPKLLEYLKSVPYPSVLKTWCEKLGIDYHNAVDGELLQRQLQNGFNEDIDFLCNLPLALDFDDFIFVHAGVECIEDWKASKLEFLLASKAFLNQKHRCSQYVVVGHWPTSNYRKQSVNDDIIIDRDARIICIDGGYGVKINGHINALIIEKQSGSYRFSTQSVDDYIEYKVIETHKIEGQKAVKLDWEDNAIDLVDRQSEFSLCRKVSTGELLYIKNEFIEAINDSYVCNDDYISLFLSVEAGDTVKVVGFYGGYAFAKHHNEFGWIHKDMLDVSV